MKKVFSTLEEANAHIDGLETQLKAANTAKEKAESDLTAALGSVEEISTQLSLMQAHKGENVNVVKVGTKNYKLLGNRFFVDGVEVDAAALMLNKKELERMVKINSGSLIDVESITTN